MCASRMYASRIITRITAGKRVNIARSRATYRMFPVLNFEGISREMYVSFVRYCRFDFLRLPQKLCVNLQEYFV